MGQFSLIAVVGAFLLSGVVVFNAARSASNAEDKVWEHQYHVIARDAASTGMSVTTRQLGNSLNAPWNGALAAALAQTDEDYDGGRYSVTATAHSGSCALLTPANFAAAVSGSGLVLDGQVIEVRATGNYDGAVGGDAVQSHQQVACFVKADWSLFSPPAFNFGFISDLEFSFNANADINALVDGNGHVHSNGDLYLGKNVEIDGVATHVGGSTIKTDDVVEVRSGVDIPMTPFDADAFADELMGTTGASVATLGTYCTDNPTLCRYDTGFTSTGGTTTVDPTPSIGTDRYPSGPNTPYVWVVDGNFDLSGGAHVKLPQYTTIVVTGTIGISGTSAVTTNGETLEAYCQRVRGKRCSQISETATPSREQVSRDWVVSQLFDGKHSPVAWYGEQSVTVQGTSALIGNFYVNGDVTLGGGGDGNNTIGSFASTGGDVNAKGGGQGSNFWFLDVADDNVIDGVKLPGKQIVRLAMAEWTDPVLDH